MPETSVIVPTFGRSSSLRDCLDSLWSQTYQDFEIIRVTEEGPLAKLRNKGAAQAKGKYLVFIDDDVVAPSGWLESIVKIFDSKPAVGGVSGPAIIPRSHRKNRDLFRFRSIKFFHDLIFLGWGRRIPGHFSRAGAWSTKSSEERCSYEGEVQFLEACNMAFRTDVFRVVGGFDEAYLGIGDWSEPDLAFRVKRAGFRLWFSRNARLYHLPSRVGAFRKRKFQSDIRLSNYELFSKRWIKPCREHSLYKRFLKFYYAIASSK